MATGSTKTRRPRAKPSAPHVRPITNCNVAPLFQNGAICFDLRCVFYPMKNTSRIQYKRVERRLFHDTGVAGANSERNPNPNPNPNPTGVSGANSERFTAGNNAVKNSDDTACTTCGQAQFRSSNTACKASPLYKAHMPCICVGTPPPPHAIFMAPNYHLHESTSKTRVLSRTNARVYLPTYLPTCKRGCEGEGQGG